jgi:two-component system sensor histidine kinase QseC
MKSIRIYLLLLLLATITLVDFVALLHGYQSSMAKSEQLFDSRLQGNARLIAVIYSNDSKGQVVQPKGLEHTYFQILTADGSKITARSTNAPLTGLSELENGFNTVNYGGHRWRQYALFDEANSRWVIVAERWDIHFSLAEDVIMASLIPIILAMPLIALLIWFVVGGGLKPLKKLAEQVSVKQADDLSPIKLDNVPSELKSVVDKTNQLLQRLKDSFDREQRFSADASHELRTPISALKLHLHNIKHGHIEKHNELTLLEQGIERVEHLVEQMLALYRTSPDQAALAFEVIDLNQRVQNVIAEFYGWFEDKDQTIVLNGDEALILGNPFAIDTLVKNLLSNASKYAPLRGHVYITITQSDTATQLIVEDSGPGIPVGLHERVFERFYRVNGDRHSSGETGCGLGLTIIQHIVLLHKGTINLSSSDHFQSGLKVTVTLPKGNLRD